MIEITFREFFEYAYQEDGFHELYVMKNGYGDILYIGISSQNIWNRWFGWNGHIMGDANFMVGESDIGRMVVDHLPESWEWKIQLWTLNDCVKYCADVLNPNGKYDIKMLEAFMIQKFRPSLNATYNLNPSINRTPKSEKEKRREAELDRAFRKALEKKP